MAARRAFTTEFKMQVVREYLAGTTSRAALARRHQLSPDQIVNWQKRYEAGTLTPAGGAGEQAGLHARIAALERMVGRLTMENDLLKKPPPSYPRREARVPR